MVARRDREALEAAIRAANIRLPDLRRECCEEQRAGNRDTAPLHPSELIARGLVTRPALSTRAVYSFGSLEGDSQAAAAAPLDGVIFDVAAYEARKPRRRKPTPSGPPFVPPSGDIQDLYSLPPPYQYAAPGAAGAALSASVATQAGPDHLKNPEPSYCEVGDQSMVAKWINHSKLRVRQAAWRGMPAQIAFTTETDHFHGGGTWKAWHLLSAGGQTGYRCAAYYASCVACVGDTEWKVEYYEPILGWQTVVDTVIPQGHWMGFSQTFWVPFPPPPAGQLLPAVVPIPWHLLFGNAQQFVGVDVRMRGEGGQHRYFIHFRRPNDGFDIFQDTRSMAQLNEDGLLPDGFQWLEPPPTPDDD